MKPLAQHHSPSPHFWVWPNLIGLDAPIVAVCWQAMFAKMYKADLPWFIHLILGLSTWSIYLADRIIDVGPNRNQSTTSRHLFTKRHVRGMIGILFLISTCNLVLIIQYLPQRLLFTGCITLGLIGIYYLIRLTRLKNSITLIPREVMCGMLFALGCAIAPHAYSSHPWINTPTLFIPILLFGIVCSSNCILISIWENVADSITSDSSIITTHSFLIRYLTSTLTCLSAASATLAYFFHWQALLSIALSAALLRLALHHQNRFTPLNLRVLADAVLLTPLIFMGF
jgi:hypothetical protein